MDGLSVIIAVGVIAVFLAQFGLGFLVKEQWVHGILPLLWLIAGVILLVQEDSIVARDIIMLALGFFVLFAIAGRGEQLHKEWTKKRSQEESRGDL